MMNALDHPLVADYLQRLHGETVRLRVDEARELEMQIREHLTEALGPDPSEGSVREVLDRLGAPAELVDAAGGATAGPGSTADRDAARSPGYEVGALVALVGAALLFWLPPVNLVLWLGGLVFLVLARRWTVAEKVWGGIVLGLSWWFPLLLFVLPVGPVAPGSKIIAISALVLWLALYLWTLFRLARSASRSR